MRDEIWDEWIINYLIPDCLIIYLETNYLTNYLINYGTLTINYLSGN